VSDEIRRITQRRAARAALIAPAGLGLAMVGRSLIDDSYHVGWAIFWIGVAIFAWFAVTIRCFLYDLLRWDKRE
jgi:hypothetical protein